MKGIKRFRQAIKNQRDFGNGDFRLTYHDAEEIANEIEAELAQLVWAKGVPAPVDADGEVVPLDTTELYTDGGEMIRVSNIRFNGYSWLIGTVHKYGLYGLDELHLAQPDSWERLEKDVERCKNQECACAYFDHQPVNCAECQIAGEDCSTFIAGDIFRRAKALAGRKAKTFTPQPSPHGAKEAAE